MHVPKPGEQCPATNEVKDLWISRLDHDVGKSHPAIYHERHIIQLKDREGVFDGKDSGEIWLNGDRRFGTYNHQFDKSWPWEDPIQSYPMYTRC